MGAWMDMDGKGKEQSRKQIGKGCQEKGGGRREGRKRCRVRSPEGACPKRDAGFAALPFIPPWGVCPRRPEQLWLQNSEGPLRSVPVFQKQPM